MAFSPINATDGSVKSATWIGAFINCATLLKKTQLDAKEAGAVGIAEDLIAFSPVGSDTGGYNYQLSAKIPISTVYDAGTNSWSETLQDPLSQYYTWDGGTGDLEGTAHGFAALKKIAEHTANSERRIVASAIFNNVNTTSVTKSEDGQFWQISALLPSRLDIDPATTEPLFRATDFLTVVDNNFAA